MPDPTAADAIAELFDGLQGEVDPYVSEHHAPRARRRGRQRTIRRQVAASLVAATLVAGGATAVALLNGHQTAPRPVTASPSADPSATSRLALPAPSYGSSPASGSASPGTSQPAVAGADPDTVVTTAWLTPAQMSALTGATWTVPTHPGFQLMQAAEPDLGTCLPGYPQQFGGVAHWQVGAGLTRSDGSSIYEAQFFFPDAAAARNGLTAIETAYAHCQGRGTADYLPDPHIIDTVRVVVQADGRFSMVRTLRHPDGTPAETATTVSDAHECLVQRGNVIYFVSLGYTTGSTSHDPQVLSAMFDALGNYPQ